jgi:uncharacterized protein
MIYMECLMRFIRFGSAPQYRRPWTSPLAVVRSIAALAAIVTTQAQADTDELLRAVQGNDLPALQKIVGKAGPKSVNAADSRGYTLLMVAAREGRGEIVTYLVREKAQVNVRNSVGETALMLAAFKGNLPIVQTLLKEGALVNGQGWTSLHYAAYEGHANVCRFLIDNEAEIDARAPNGSTPLMVAARQGHEEAVKLLLWEQADPNLTNSDGATALSWALKNKHGGIAKLLRDAGAKK